MCSISQGFIKLTGQLDLVVNIRIKKKKKPVLKQLQKMCTCQSDVVWGQMTLRS